MRFRISILAVTALLTVLAACTSAPTPGITPPAAAPGDDTAVQGSQEDGSVKVHGHWTIEVKDGDETVAITEFENSLTGATNLARVLAGERVVGPWVVEIFLENLCLDSGASARCQIHSPHTPFSGDHIFPNLEVEASGGALRLSGTFTAATDGSVNSVRTTMRTCANTVAPANCDGAGGVASFTSKTIPSSDRVSVVAKQQVLVTVEITFS